MKDITTDILLRIKDGDARAFEEVFRLYYGPLHNLAVAILKDDQLGEEQVQEVFIKLWERREILTKDFKLFPYLITSVRNRCYNQTRNNQVKQKYVEHEQRALRDEVLHLDHPEDLEQETLDKVYQVIDQLPEKCREVFMLSRFERLGHKEIAEKLGISTKTIENHITKAMRILRDEFLVILFLIGDLI